MILQINDRHWLVHREQDKWPQPNGQAPKVDPMPMLTDHIGFARIEMVEDLSGAFSRRSTR